MDFALAPGEILRVIDRVALYPLLFGGVPKCLFWALRQKVCSRDTLGGRAWEAEATGGGGTKKSRAGPAKAAGTRRICFRAGEEHREGCTATQGRV